MVEGRDGGGVHIVIYIRIGISLGLERGRKVYFRESENVAIEMTLNQGRLVHIQYLITFKLFGGFSASPYTFLQLTQPKWLPYFYLSSCSPSVTGRDFAYRRKQDFLRCHAH
jgi:hypothetical protein